MSEDKIEVYYFQPLVAFAAEEENREPVIAVSLRKVAAADGSSENMAFTVHEARRLVVMLLYALQEAGDGVAAELFTMILHGGPSIETWIARN